MICFFLILGIIEFCRAIRWDVPSGHGGQPSFGHVPLDNNFINNVDQHNFVGDFTEKKSINGLEAWLAEVVIGKDYHGLVKPLIKEIAYPVYKNMEVQIPYPQIQHEMQRYPIFVPMLRQIPYEVVKTIFKKVEKKVPAEISQIVPYAVHKPVPFEVTRWVPMFQEQKIFIKKPYISKTIHHKIE